MYNSKASNSTRKRAAPGASPAPQMAAQTYAAPTQMANGNSDYGKWNNENNGFSDPPSAYNMNVYSGNSVQQPVHDHTQAQASSTQLARRPMNRQLVQTTQRFDNGNDPWSPFGDDPMLDLQHANIGMEENDNIELLEERAATAKRDAQSKRKQIPPFVQKLSSFLDESKNTELIRWSDRGDSFVVLDEDEFAKTLIPELFKHNNYASFVRQLNMYGFHKRVGLSDNSMKASERKNKSPSEYYNQFFKRGHPNLLWLINKPKGGTSKSKKGKKGGDEAHDGGSDDEGHEIEEVYGNNVPHARAISQAPETGPLQRRDMTVLQNQLLEIQKQQGNITNAISRLRNDHNELYQQARAFQSLHDRHENSIQAILTFLATVYNRSLDGQGPQNFAQMFAPGIPHDNHGSVVDIKDVTDQQDQTPGNLSPHRRQRLLMAPPGQGGGGGTPSTIVSSAGNTPNPQLNQGYSTPQSAAIEELFDSPADTTSPKLHSKQDASHQAQQPRQNMMNIINSTNAQARAQRPGPGNSTNPQQGHLQFPAVLSHYENSNGGTALTNAQRNEMLNLMAATAPNATSNSNNALVSPSPEIPSVADIQYTQAEIDDLLRLQRDQEERISSIKSQIEPLSPSGSIPGLSSDVGGYFENAAGDGNGSTISGLDLDQFLDFGNGNLTAGNGMGGFDDHFGDASVGMDGVDVGEGESDFDFGLGGTVDQGMNGNLGAAGTAGQDRSGTPEISGYEAGRSGANEEQGPRSPSKRRKRN